MSGTKSGPISMDGWGHGDVPDAIVQWGSPRRIDNDGGAWIGRFSGIYTAATSDLITLWFDGAGGYEGLSFVEWLGIGPAGDASTGFPVLGLIFPGSPPNMGEPGAVPSAAPAGTAPWLPATPSSTPIVYGTGRARAFLVRGTGTCDFGGIVVPSPDPDAVIRVRDASLPCRYELNDPRVGGAQNGAWNADVWGGPSGARVEWSAPRRIDNAGGAWIGSLSGIYTGETGHLLSGWFNGTGSYSGLSFFAWIVVPPGPGTNASIVGLVYPGSAPQF